VIASVTLLILYINVLIKYLHDSLPYYNFKKTSLKLKFKYIGSLSSFVFKSCLVLQLVFITI